MTVASDMAKAIRSAIAEVNYWFESESDSPFKVSRSRSTVRTEDRIKALDMGMRRSMAVGSGYQLPNLDQADIREKDLSIFQEEIARLAILFDQTYQGIALGNYSYQQLENVIETLEFHVELHNLLDALENTTLTYVDYPDDPYVGLIIIGLADSVDRNGAPAKEAIIMRSLLTQT